MNIQNTIERTIISTMLFNEEYLYEKAITLDEKYFVLPFHKMLIKRIIEGVTKGESISRLNIKLDAYFRDVKTEYQKVYIDILATVPLPMKVAQQYYEELKIQYRVGKIK